MNKTRAIGLITLAAIAGATVAVIYALLAVSGQPYFRGPWIVGLTVGFLTMPALLIQELYPESWAIRYNWTAIIVGNGVWYALFMTISCLAVGIIKRHRR